MRRGDVSSCGRQRGEAVRGGHTDFLTGPGPYGALDKSGQHPCPRNISLRYDPQPCPGWTLGDRHEPDTGTPQPETKYTGKGLLRAHEGRLQPGAAKSGRRTGHEGPQRKQKLREEGRWALQWSQHRAPRCALPRPAPPSASAPPPGPDSGVPADRP